MMESVRKVEATRPERVAQAEAGHHFPRMNEQETEAILTEYHPDYREGTKRPLAIGVGKGTIVPNELADLLEARPLIGPEDVDLDKIDFVTDVLVIGGFGSVMPTP